MAARTRKPDARKSAVRLAVEHVLAHQKGPVALVARTIGIAMAEMEIDLASLACNMKRLIWPSGTASSA